MTNSSRFAHFFTLALLLFASIVTHAQADYHTDDQTDYEEVLYFASGWPIALADAACGDDEGCLTELANCPPGPDGSCFVQAALCEVTTAYGAFPCTVRLEGASVLMRFPDATTVTWDQPSRGSVAALNGTYTQQGPSCLSGSNGFGACFTLLTDPAVLTQWAGGTPPDN